MKYTINPKIDKFLPYSEALLKARGVETPRMYLNPMAGSYLDASGLDHIDAGCALITKHVNNPISRIAIIVDSDMDGICSAAMVYLWLTDYFGVDRVDYFLHKGKQHGLEDTVYQVMDYDLVIVPDAGSNDYNEHKMLREAGTDVLVLDHHEAEKYSDDAVVINNQLSANYSNKSLCGAGVVLKFIHYYEAKHSEDYVPKHPIAVRTKILEKYFDLAGAAIVADVMSLKNQENRYIVSHGLSHIQNYGLKTFIEKQAYSLKGEVTPIGIGFYIAPIVNAIIRVGTDEDKDLLFRAFIRGSEREPSTKRGHKPGDTEIVAEKAFRIGTNCRSKQNKLMDMGEAAVLEQIIAHGLDEYPIIFVELPDEIAEKIPSELTGLIAMRINNVLNKPTLIGRFADDECVKGSIRNNGQNGLDFKEFLNRSKCMDFVEGHANAAGFGIKANKIDDLLDFATRELSDEMVTQRIYEVDYEFTSEKFWQLINLTEEIVPSMNTIWGNDIEPPRIAIKDIVLDPKDALLMGADKDSIKFTINDIEIVCFKNPEFIEKLMSYTKPKLTAIGEVGINTFGGKRKVQFIIKDYEIADARFDF